MGLIALLLILFGVVGVIVQYFRIAIYAYKEHSPVWGLVCLFISGANVIWGIVHWKDDEARTLFLRYLYSIGFIILGMILNSRFNRIESY
jgi:hypothetical protein